MNVSGEVETPLYFLRKHIFLLVNFSVMKHLEQRQTLTYFIFIMIHANSPPFEAGGQVFEFIL